MFTFDPGAIGGIFANVGTTLLSYAAIATLLYGIGAILIRTVSWEIDKLLINLIGTFFKYFEEILGGTLFTESIVDGLMNRVYLLIGVFVAFRLGMLLLQYIINPAEVLEEKGGVNSLIKRAIIGLSLIIFIPTIFDIANNLQKAIIADQVIEKVILDESTFATLENERKNHGTGTIVAMTIFQGFWNVDKNQVSDKNIIKAFEDAETKLDPNVVEEAGYGILAESGSGYAWNYFPILSTVVLGYVLYLVIKYCIDMVLRLFKLLVLQILSPITIIEYIVNGDRNEIFQKWKKAVIANYALLFVRVFTIWFTTYVAWLMRTGVGGESLLNTQDYLLKAIIVLALLAFMMDFPKMMSDLFGLDLEQDSAVKGVMGKAIGAGVAGLAVGGAVAGLGMKAAKGASGTLKGGMANFAANKGKAGFAAGLSNPRGAISKAFSNSTLGRSISSKLSPNVKEFGSSLKESAKENKLGTTLKAGAMAVGAAALASNSLTKSAQGGYQQTAGAISGDINKEKQARQEEMQAKMSSDISRMTANMNFQSIVELAARIKAVNPTIPDLPQAVVDAQIKANPNIPSQVVDLAGKISSVADPGTGQINDVTVAQQTVVTQLQDAGMSQSTINQMVTEVQTTYAGGGSIGAGDANNLMEKAYNYEYKPQAEQASKLVP